MDLKMLRKWLTILQKLSAMIYNLNIYNLSVYAITSLRLDTGMEQFHDISLSHTHTHTHTRTMRGDTLKTLSTNQTDLPYVFGDPVLC